MIFCPQEESLFGHIIGGLCLPLLFCLGVKIHFLMLGNTIFFGGLAFFLYLALFGFSLLGVGLFVFVFCCHLEGGCSVF